MSRFLLIAGVMFFLFYSAGFAAEETVPPKIFVGHFTAPAGKTAQAFVLEEETRSIISSLSNIQLVLDFQATNYGETGDIVKYLMLNNIYGYIMGDLKQAQGGFELSLKAVNRDNKIFQYSLSFSDLTEGIGKMRASIKPWIEEKFPRLQKNVVVKEEVERVGVGRFEYFNPAVIAEAGVLFSGSSIPVLNFFTNNLGLYVDSAVRYGLFGFNAGGSVSLTGVAGYSVYAGPELNLLNGLLTLTARIGYRMADANSGNSGLGLKFQCFFLSPVIMMNVTDRYQISLGGYFTPVSDINRIDYSMPALTNMGQGWEYQYSGKFDLTGGFLHFNIGITPDIWFGFQYDIWLVLIPNAGSMPPLVVNSSLMAGLSYKFTMGGR